MLLRHSLAFAFWAVSELHTRWQLLLYIYRLFLCKMAFAPSDIRNKTVAEEYQVILNELNKAVHENQPDDVLQFCANFFIKRLEHERSESRQVAITREVSHEKVAGIYEFLYSIIPSFEILGGTEKMSIVMRFMQLAWPTQKQTRQPIDTQVNTTIIISSIYNVEVQTK
jgi:hypothetical protein